MVMQAAGKQRPKWKTDSERKNNLDEGTEKGENNEAVDKHSTNQATQPCKLYMYGTFWSD
jgi:hypothetical protein